MGGWWIWQTNERCRRRAESRCTRALQAAPQAHRAVYGFALKLAFGVDGGIEDVGFGSNRAPTAPVELLHGVSAVLMWRRCSFLS